MLQRRRKPSAQEAGGIRTNAKCEVNFIPTQRARLGALPWALLGAAGWVFVYADRAVLSPLYRTFGRIYHVGPQELGLIATAFFLTYTAVQIPAGRLADRLSARLLLGIGYIGFGLLTLLTGFAPSFAALLVITALAGLAQGVYYPTQFAVTARRIPENERPAMNAVITSGMGIGIAVGYLLAALLGQVAWQVPVWILGAGTIALGVVLTLAAPPGVSHRAPVDSSRRGIPGRLWFLLLLNFCSLYGFFFLLAWLPYYLHSATPLRGGLLGLAASWPMLVAVPATILIGRRAMGDGRIRRMRLLLVLAAVSFAVLPMAGADLLPVLLLLTLYGMSGKLVIDPLILSEVADDLEPGQYGQAFGLLNFVGMLASVAAPALTGLLVEWTGSFTPAFAAATGFLVIGLGLTAGLRTTPTTSR